MKANFTRKVPTNMSSLKTQESSNRVNRPYLPAILNTVPVNKITRITRESHDTVPLKLSLIVAIPTWANCESRPSPNIMRKKTMAQKCAPGSWARAYIRNKYDIKKWVIIYFLYFEVCRTLPGRSFACPPPPF